MLRNPLTTDATLSNYQVFDLQKVDTYAFAILLYQLQTRSPHPFGREVSPEGEAAFDWQETAQILTMVTRIDEYTFADDAPYRPVTTGHPLPPFVQSAITDAWHENPFLRPELKVNCRATSPFGPVAELIAEANFISSY